MILFLEDWEKSNAVADIHTTNRSFVHMARLLKSMGIKNHMFFLALLDQRLREINPFSPTLTVEEVSIITQECYLNPWYFFREIARAPGMAGAPARMLEANRGNIGLFWSFFNHVMTLLIQVRQTGKSFNSDVLAIYLMEIRCRNTQINLLTKDETLRRSNIQRLKDIADALPRCLDLRGRKDANNSELITVKQHGNLYQAHLPQASEKLAGNVGRGLVSPIFFVDEPPFQLNIQEALPAALAAGGAAREIAADAGEPYGTILTTTAGRKDTKEGAYIFNKILAGMATWTEKFYDAKNQSSLYEIIRANSRSKEVRVNITLNHSQLGKNDEWLRGKIADSVSTSDKADRDFFNRWTAGTISNPLSIATLEKIRKSEREPMWQEVAAIGGYITRWFIPECDVVSRMKAEPSIVVFDTSEASGGDDISMRVTGIRSGMCFATATINNTNIITFSEWVATWLTRWDNTTMLIERRSTGSAVLDMLLLILPAKDIDPFARIFNRITNAPDEHKEMWEIVKEPMWRRPSDFLERCKKHFGFATSGSGLTSRGSLYGQVLSAAANTVGHLVCDKTTVDQIASLITKNGRVDHEAGEHDDMVIGWILTHWFMIKATNIRYYGIDATQVLTEVREAVDLTPMQRLKSQQQLRLKTRMRELLETLKATQDDYVVRTIEHELRVIYTRIEQTGNEKISVDELIAQAKDEKFRKRIEGFTNNSTSPMMREQEKLQRAKLNTTGIFQQNSRWGASSRFI